MDARQILAIMRFLWGVSHAQGPPRRDAGAENDRRNAQVKQVFPVCFVILNSQTHLLPGLESNNRPSLRKVGYGMKPLLHLRPIRPRMAVSFRCAAFTLALLATLVFTACSGSSSSHVVRGEMGQKLKVEDISYTVLGADWVEALGEGATARIPNHRFLLVRIAATNESGGPAEMGSLKLIASNGAEYGEVANGGGVNEWLGMSRELDAKGTKQGVVLFDAPKAVYELQVADAFYDEESGSAALIQIPVRPEGAQPAISGALP